MFIIDLDDTLLNTQTFKQARIKALHDLGVSDDLYKTSYKEAYNNASGINIYNSSSHAEVLAKHGFDRKEILSALQRVEEGLKDLLFPGTEDLLNFLKEKRQKLILLSLGEEGFQKMKIKQTGLAKFFDLIFTVNDTKEHIIQKILKDYPDEQEVWLVNDKIDETKKIKQLFPILKPILKMSPVFNEAEYKDSSINYFSTLTQIKQYVEQQLG